MRSKSKNSSSGIIIVLRSSNGVHAWLGACVYEDEDEASIRESQEILRCPQITPTRLRESHPQDLEPWQHPGKAVLPAYDSLWLKAQASHPQKTLPLQRYNARGDRLWNYEEVVRVAKRGATTKTSNNCDRSCNLCPPIIEHGVEIQGCRNSALRLLPVRYTVSDAAAMRIGGNGILEELKRFLLFPFMYTSSYISLSLLMDWDQ